MSRFLRLVLRLALFAALCGPGVASALDIYRGTLGKQSITLVTDYQNRIIRGLYFYDRYRTPIRLKPVFSSNEPHGTAMDELDTAGLPAARIRFTTSGYFKQDATLNGTWTDYRTGKSLPIQMKHVARLSSDEAWPGATVEVPQAASTERFYFQVPLARDGAPATAIEVYAKKTGKRVQSLSLPGCRNEGLETVQLALEQGITQLRVGKRHRCAGVAFALDERTGQFEPLR
ncbi:hypothetical protein [Pseudomonas tohonis]|uniref:hypothetical protein n=1 Tax=Pseudomonas tohonis TaxID=2725477 RepID=UPI0021DA045C|nr:hypothetical protein [Pseudomonas tohonis]UXY55593.1 hypothetical protein N9L84_13790 [Pseudomonas tohonis]